MNLCRSGLKRENLVSKNQLVLGQLGWKAFTAQTPELMFELVAAGYHLFYRFCRAPCYVFLRNFLQRDAD